MASSIVMLLPYGVTGVAGVQAQQWPGCDDEVAQASLHSGHRQIHSIKKIFNKTTNDKIKK